MPKVFIKRGTRTQLDAAATASGLNAGEPYLITDENRLAIGLTTTTYQDFSLVEEAPAKSFLNNTGATLTAGTVVYVAGSSGQQITIAKAQANAEATSSKTIGLVYKDVANGAQGHLVSEGILKNVNTLGLTEGAALWLSPSAAGGFTTTKPVAPDHAVLVGFVISANASSGRIFVKVSNGWELEELHNVSITNPADNEVLAYDSASGLWTNQVVAGGSGSPGGSNLQIQYNNNGVFGGASWVCIDNGYLLLTDSGVQPGVPPANNLKVFAEDHAGKLLPSIIGPSGVDYNLQAALYGNTTYMWLAGTGTTVAINWGTSFINTNTGSGAQATNVKTSASAIASMNKASFGTGTASATDSSGIRSTTSVAWLGNAAGLGGFLFFARFGLEAVSGTYRCFVGLSSLAGTANAEPSTLVDSCILCKDTADTTWQISVRGAAVQKINTGITITVGQVLDVFIHSGPNSQSIKFHIKDAVTGEDLYISSPITTNLPTATVFMLMHAQIDSVTGTASKILGLNRMYCETDL